MRRIGIRELRQNASQYIRLVKAGETIEVTEHDVPVARLTPLPKPAGERKRREELIEQGLLVPGQGDWRELAPVEPRAGVKPASQVLAEMREDER